MPFPVSFDDRIPKIKNRLSLPLFVFGVDADHPHHAFAVDDLALVAHFFYWSTDFHLNNPQDLPSLESLWLLFISVSNPSAVQIVGRQLNQDPIPGKNPDKMLTHLAGNMRQHLMLVVFQLNPKHSVRQSLKDLSHNFYSLFLCHIRSERILPVPTNCK
jgi:hypothetical protein